MTEEINKEIKSVKLKPSIKSVEGGAAISTILGMILAAYYILTQDNSIDPGTIKIIVEEALSKASTVQEIKEILEMTEKAPENYTKMFELISVLLPGTGLLGWFIKKRTDVKETELLVNSNNSKLN